jgi:hypothetical protein
MTLGADIEYGQANGLGQTVEIVSKLPTLAY